MKKIALFLMSVLMVTMMALPAMAAEFTPSVEQKEAPAVATVTNEAGEEVVAIIRDAQEKEVSGVPYGALVVTPVSKADQSDAGIREALNNAYDQIQKANSLTEIAPNIEEALKAAGSDANVSDLVVQDLFDVSVSGTYAELLAQEGNTITIRFSVNIAPSTTLIVLHNVSGSEWEVIPNERVVRNSDGTVDVTFTSLSPVAFVVDSAVVEPSPDGPKAPQTGYDFPVAGIAVALAGCAALIGVCLVQKKHTWN